MEDSKLDKIFRSAASEQRIEPSSEAWARLEGHLDKRKPLWFSGWIRYAAIFAGLLVGGYWVYMLSVPTTDHPSWLVTELSETRNLPVEIPLPKSEISTETPQVTSIASPSSVPKGSREKAIERKPDLLPTTEVILPMDDNTDSWIAEILEPEIEIVAQEMSESKVGLPIEGEAADHSEVRVRIVSNGNAFVAQKPDFKEGIEESIEKVGGFIARVDQGFADLQDVKNNLFASVVTQKKNR